MQPEMFSPSAELAGKTVFVTGGLGFLGSVVVEQLLRLTEVKKVYLLARGKKQLSAAQRVDKLLCSALFNMLHEEAAAGGCNVFSKVAAVEGDMNAPGLGLSEQDTAALAGEVQVVIHCAASLELDAPIQKTLRSNYLGTQRLLRLASTWPSLACLLFTSTYFVNNFKPRNSLVREELHNVPLSLPLSAPNEALTHSQLVEALLAMEADSADAEASALMASLNFTSTYAFGKLLTEHLVGEAQLELVEALLAMEAEDADAEAAALMRQLNFTSTYAFGKLLTEHLVEEAQLQVGGF
uniref:Fatty acyl-CoA reductase n=1 Tax=Tetradesmus obliquus TaxID=3088 RepID=A0A383W7M2_TETOB|eukprot:jgi/Sobl393_1/3680/SZX73200.1